MGRFRLDSPLRKHVLRRLFLSCEKKTISNLHVIDMPLNEPNHNLIFFYHAVLPSQTCRIPHETKKILGPKIITPNFQALISPSPEIFP